MNSYLLELAQYSYPFDRSDLFPKNQNEMVKINDKDRLNKIRVSEKFEELAMRKMEHEEHWNSFVNEVKLEGRFIRVTDRSQLAHSYSFKLELLLEGNYGLGFCLSQIGQLIGIYFTNQSLKANIPIVEFRSAVGVLSKKSPNHFICYFPFSVTQIDATNRLLEICEYYFKDFQLFNNYHASTKIQDLVIGDQNIYESDLFQVLFADNLVVI
jgi:hypothetical protein